MPLDFAQVYEDGELTGPSVGFRQWQHRAVFEDLSDETYPLLARAKEYYEDTFFRLNELKQLQAEIRAVRSNQQDERIVELLKRLEQLVSDAENRGYSVDVISD